MAAPKEGLPRVSDGGLSASSVLSLQEARISFIVFRGFFSVNDSISNQLDLS